MVKAPVQLPITLAFGERVWKARRALKLTQEQLAELAGVSRESISKIERGVANPGLVNMNSVALALGDSFAGFFIPWQAPKT